MVIEKNVALTTADLVRDVQSGNLAAFGELFERYRGSLVGLAVQRIGCIEEAEELTQDVFVQAMEKIHQLRVPEAFGGWLRQIMCRMAINRGTRRARPIATDPETLAATLLADGSPEGLAMRHEDMVNVREAVARLRALDRQTLQAYYFHGQTLAEMSDHFSAPLGTIKRRLHEARLRLAKELDAAQAV